MEWGKLGVLMGCITLGSMIVFPELTLANNIIFCMSTAMVGTGIGELVTESIFKTISKNKGGK